MAKNQKGTKILTPENCTSINVRAMRDALEVLSGKWKLPILLALAGTAKRFNQIAKEVPDITDKMLSKELKDMEANQLIERKVFDTFPPTVEYSTTAHSMTLEKVMSELSAWGILHRMKILGK
jgi:DNA-binding HxlR family transcriptional regulator